jgi:hypothetical protein
MSSKEQPHIQDKAASKQHPAQRTGVHPEQRAGGPTNPGALVERALVNPHSLTSHNVTQLQRAIGNRAVGRLLETTLQRRTVQPVRGVEGEEFSGGEVTLLRRQENRTGLPDNLKAGVENLSGVSLDNVRVHYNSAEPARVQALAYTRGTNIHVGPGQEAHLPHEAWHVVQQRQGRVVPTIQARGVAINDDESLETEADEMGRQALVVQPFAASSTTRARLHAVEHPPSSHASPIQRRRFDDDAEAVTWLVTALNTVLTAKRLTTPQNYVRARMETYLGGLSDALASYETMSALLRAHGGAYYAAEDRAANLNNQLQKASVHAAAIRQMRAQELTLHYGAKARTVTADQQEHIFLGTVDNAQNPTTVTGYHWEGDGASVAVTSGAKQNTEAKFGVYQRAVNARGHALVRKAGGSATASTFYPDTWSKADILEAIEYAQVNGARLEARTPAKAAGLMILANDASFFPDAPGNQPA